MNMQITFENIIDQVVNNRTISRKEKQVVISRFLKAHGGSNKPTSEEHLAVIENLKAIKKAYSERDTTEKQAKTSQHSFL